MEGDGDSDSDGIPDYEDTDSDGDGVPDSKRTTETRMVTVFRTRKTTTMTAMAFPMPTRVIVIRMGTVFPTL